jgi:hypothetical protein
MAGKEDCDNYAAVLAQRYDDLIKWAIANWPKKDFPLLESDFEASRRELAEILGSKLGDSTDCSSSPVRTHEGDTGQYRDMNPMPWP